MKTIPDPWRHLLVLARDAAPVLPPAVTADPADDLRFAARVVSAARRRGVTLPTTWVLPWEAWSLRGMAAAGATAAVMLAWNFSLLRAETIPDDVLPPDPVAELAATF